MATHLHWKAVWSLQITRNIGRATRPCFLRCSTELCWAEWRARKSAPRCLCCAAHSCSSDNLPEAFRHSRPVLAVKVGVQDYEIGDSQFLALTTDAFAIQSRSLQNELVNF